MKKFTKILSLLLVSVMVIGMLAACKKSDSGSSGKTVKIGVLVADVSGEEALGFAEYYKNYIAKNYKVEFSYTEQLKDAAGEKAAIEKFAAQGYDAIISFSASDRATQIETCVANKLYYAIASGMLDDEQYEKYKGEQYFVGQIGPSMDTEYEAGYAMGKHFADKGVKSIALYGAFIPNPMHVYRAAGVLAGIGATYGGASDKDAIVGQIFADQGIDLSKVGAKDVKVVGYLQGFGDTTFDELFGAISSKPDAFLSVGMATTFFTDTLNQNGIAFSDIDSFTTANGTAMKDGKLVYLAGKYSSSIGPIFAATMNAVNGNPVRNADGSALSISQSYLVATDSASFEKYFNADKGDSPIYNKEILDTIIGKVSVDDFTACVTADRG